MKKTKHGPFFNLPLPLQKYRRASPLVLVNGLAEQPESWFANRGYWNKFFDVKAPELLVYSGSSLHKHIDAGGEVTVDYLTERLHLYLEEFVQNPPYDLVGSSLGGQIIANYAVRYPDRVNKLVFLCPSGFHGEENLPVMEGVRRSQYDTLVRSVFHRGGFASDELIEAIERKFQDRSWKKGVLRTLRGTVGHSVSPLLEQITQPSLVIWGGEDKILADIPGAIHAADRMQEVRQIVIPKCGHAPQIERSGLVNRLVVRFLRGKIRMLHPALDPKRYLAQAARKV
jgi:pimeloyl-ACP methyl ester carboxylesterase